MMKFSSLLLVILICNSSFAVEIAFIVNDQTQIQSLRVQEVKDYYYKRVRHWPDGTAVRFIDRGAHSDVRKDFLSSILKISEEDLDQFWIGQKLYTGDSAPLQQPSESLILQLVSSLKGAISYVPLDTKLPPKGIRVIKVEHGSL